jgi:uncharacterized membrane protein
MSTTAHLWAVGFDNAEQAHQVREEIARLGWGAGRADKYILLLDLAVVVRHADGSFEIDRKPQLGLENVLACTGAGFLAGLVVAAPLTGAAIGALLGSAGTAAAAHAGISAEFIRAVESLMKPGTSALFVLDEPGDMDVILANIRGLGGVVLKTNVELDRVRLIEATLAAARKSPQVAAGKLDG